MARNATLPTLTCVPSAHPSMKRWLGQLIPKRRSFIAVERRGIGCEPTRFGKTGVGKAHVIGQATAMRDAHINKPKGLIYNAAFSAWARKFGFEGLDKGVRSRLLDVMEHLAEIDTWLAKLPPTEQQKINHPNTVWRKWKASTVVPDPNAPPRVSPYQKLSESVAALQEENDRMKRDIAQGGGDLWSPQDRPQDIAKVIVGKLTKSKAEKVAREILKMLSGAPRDA